MNYTEKYKEGFYKRIEKELNQCEIIYNPNTKGIWFVNREENIGSLNIKLKPITCGGDMITSKRLQVC